MSLTPNVRPVPPEQFSEELAEALRPRVERLGYLGGFFTCAAHQPDALLAFIRFTEELKGALPSSLTEVVALTISTSMGNAYERHQHERLSVALGFSPEWVREVESLSSEPSTTLSEAERSVQGLVLAVLDRRGHVPRGQIEAVRSVIGERETVAVLMLTGRYVAHALMANAFALQPPVESIFGPLDG